MTIFNHCWIPSTYPTPARASHAGAKASPYEGKGRVVGAAEKLNTKWEEMQVSSGTANVVLYQTPVKADREATAKDMFARVYEADTGDTLPKGTRVQTSAHAYRPIATQRVADDMSELGFAFSPDNKEDKQSVRADIDRIAKALGSAEDLVWLSAKANLFIEVNDAKGKVGAHTLLNEKTGVAAVFFFSEGVA